jgi:hypothetical protein
LRVCCAVIFFLALAPIQTSARLSEEITSNTTVRSSRRRFALAVFESPAEDTGNHCAGSARASSFMVLPAAASGMVGSSTR